MARLLLTICATLATIPVTLAVGTAFGFAASATGGGSAAAATPSDNAQLISWLSDSTARTIVLTKTYDFTSYYGTTTGAICKPWACTNGNQPQYAIDNGNWCSDSYPTGTATYYNSGASKYLTIGSNKTLLGKGSSAGIRGIGLVIQNQKNVIIQNLVFSDINAQYVWGGDAIGVIGSSNVWIDHNYFIRVGRQMIVTHFESSTVTISNNIFDGRTTWSASCNGQHYWVFLFLGVADKITLARNHIYNTSGRGPHIGGTDGNTQLVHIVNNYFDHVSGHAIDTEAGGVALVEGNYFNTVTTPSTGAAGSEYFVVSSSDVSSCTSSLGRTCVANTLLSSGTVPSGRTSSTVLTQSKAQSVVKSYAPMSASSAAAYVQASAGVGIVN